MNVLQHTNTHTHREREREREREMDGATAHSSCCSCVSFDFPHLVVLLCRRVDAIGNIFGRWQGQDDGGATAMDTGSGTNTHGNTRVYTRGDDTKVL